MQTSARIRLAFEQALELLEKGVEQDHIYSIIETGLCYYSGTLVDKDKDKAIDYWEKAVDLGSNEAKVRIAELLGIEIAGVNRLKEKMKF